MYLDQGEELNLQRNLNNYINMASQVVLQVGYHSFISRACNAKHFGGQYRPTSVID
jgi:hypothetical protein